jgi:anti-sigma-K factor RskA
MNEEEFAELAAGFALNALSPDDREIFEAERAAHPEWEHWVITDAATASALSDGVDDAPPPLTLRSSLLSRVSSTPQLPAVEAAVAAAAIEAGEPPVEAQRPAVTVEPTPTTATIQTLSRRKWTRGVLGLAASLVFLIAVGFGAVSINELVNRPPAVAALDEIESAPDAAAATVEVTGGGTATAHWAPSVGKVVLVANGLPEIADDQVFELWWVRDGDPIAAGTFDAHDGTSTVLLDGVWHEEDVVAVTVEPDGGAPEGVPTGDPILAIPTA